jgi:hypothetical protein
MRLRMCLLLLCLCFCLSETMFAQLIMFSNRSSETSVCIIVEYNTVGRLDFDQHGVIACEGKCRVKFIYSSEFEKMEMIVVLRGESRILLRITPDCNKYLVLNLFTCRTCKKREQKFDSSNTGLHIRGKYQTDEELLGLSCDKSLLKPGGIIHLCKETDGTCLFTDHTCLLNTMGLLIEGIYHREKKSWSTTDSIREFALRRPITDVAEKYSNLKDSLYLDSLLEGNPPDTLPEIPVTNEEFFGSLVKETTDYPAVPEEKFKLPIGVFYDKSLSAFPGESSLNCYRREGGLVCQFTPETEVGCRESEAYEDLALVPYKPLLHCATCGRADPPKSCACKKVRYCNKECQKKNGLNIKRIALHGKKAANQKKQNHLYQKVVMGHCNTNYALTFAKFF